MHKNYDIDAADIWRYEQNCYSTAIAENRNRHLINKLYEDLQDFFILAEHEPLVHVSEKNDNANKYRKMYHNRDDNCLPIDVFMSKGHIYDMAESCKIQLTEHNAIAFQRLFILKLRQYFDGLIYLENFLIYQLKANFKNNLANFQKFIKISLRQYPDKKDNEIISVVNEWFSEMEKKAATGKAKLRPKKGKNPCDKGRIEKEAENADITQLLEGSQDNVNTGAKDKIHEGINELALTSEVCHLNEVTREINIHELVPEETSPDVKSERNPVTGTLLVEEALPDGYKEIDGNFSKEEIISFFSFLYKEKSKEGLTFLQESEFNEIFKYGLAIPNIPVRKYKMNCSLIFPKSIVAFCICKFLRYHTTSHHKSKVLSFFANYIVDFEKALSGEDAFRNESSNIKGKMPAKMKFALSTYLPARLVT